MGFRANARWYRASALDEFCEEREDACEERGNRDAMHLPLQRASEVAEIVGVVWIRSGSPSISGSSVRRMRQAVVFVPHVVVSNMRETNSL
jgi:hypothetical protein